MDEGEGRRGRDDDSGPEVYNPFFFLTIILDNPQKVRYRKVHDDYFFKNR